uniref:A kinase-anchoring proteins AKAP-5 and AKAP-12 calmodulin (CaM)-binding domain-containing protein n=1 Tax=Poecilia reticulata TaxID=8081 RepID=A0A3P9PNN4_POERE
MGDAQSAPREAKSDALSDSGEHVSDQLLSSAESADNKKEETPAEAVSGEDGAWFSFKKLVTPQRRKKSFVDHEEGPIPGSKDGLKSAEAEQISDHSTEEGKRRKDSSVSWEAVLCGSGRRRSRKTSDSEDDVPQNSEGSKQNGGSKEPPIGTSNELQEILVSSPKQTGSPPKDDESSTWRSFKKLVTPKKKSKEEEESTYEAGQDDSAFSIKKLLSGRKTRKSVDVSPEEVDKEVASIDDEDSETPAVVPLSEFDLPETEPVAEKESNIAKDGEGEPQMETIEIKEEVQLQDIVPAEPKDIPSHEGALEKEASSAATTDEEPDELTDSSNHQQLSDIPEEGIITETTPASVAEEEAAKDETIAEDLLEITSEAITAPEPADVTLADETEMVSAVSQLSDSSKTSGNTTPVPAEYTVMNTESLLQQVSETIATSPKAVPVCLEEQSHERVVCSVSHQILEASVLNQPKMLEIHRESEATSIKTGLNAEGIDVVNEVAVTIQAESTSHLSEAISTEMVSEVPKEELDTAEPATDDVCEVNVSELQKEMKDLEITPERQHVVEGAGDVDEAVSIESLPKREEVAATEELITGQARRKTDSKEELAVTSVEDTEEAGGKEKNQTMTEEDTETKKQARNEVKPPDAVDELEEQARAETSEVAKVECYIHSPEERSPESIQLTGTPSQDLSEETKDNKEPPVVKAKTEQSAEVTEVVKAAATKLVEDLVQTLNTEVSVSENIFTAEIDTDESKPEESLPEVTEETEKKEPQNDQSEVIVELESVQVPTLESEDDTAQSLIMEAPVADDAATERDAEESLIDVTEEVERNEPETAAVQIDSAKVTEVLESAQAPTNESEEDAFQSLHKEVSSLPDSSPAEKHTEASRQLEPLAEIRDGQKDKEPQIDGAQIHQSEDTEGFESAQAPKLESQKDAVVSLNEVSLPDLSPAEKEEPKQEESLTKVTDEQEDKEVKTNVTQTDNAELKEELKSVETPTVTSDEDLIQSLNKEAEADIQDEKQEESDKPEDKEPQTDATQIKEELISPEAPILTSEEDEGQSINQSALFTENISSTVTNAEPELVKSLSEEDEEQADKERQKTIPTLESSDVTQVSDVKEVTDVVQEAPDDDQEDILASEESRVEVLGKDATPTDTIPKAETVEEKPKEEPESLIQGIIQVEDAHETENVQEPEAAAVPPDAVAISSGASDVEVIHDTSTLETVTKELIITESKEPQSVELEDSPPSPQDIASDLETCKSTTPPSDEESKTQEPETQTLLQDVPQPEDIAPEKPEGKDVLQLDQETDTKPCDAKVEHEENVLENVEGIPALTAVHVSSVNEEEARTVEVLERTTYPKETQPVCVDLVEVSEEPKSEVNLCEQQETVEGDKIDLLSAAEIKVAATDHTFISHEVMSNLKYVSSEKLNVDQEVLMSKTACEIEINDTVETATPLVLDDINQAAEPSIAVVTMRVPPVEIEVNHKVQVHLMDVDIRSAQNAVDTVIQVGITEYKEVIDVCHESIQKVDNILATAGVEAETTIEEIQVTVQEVMQHVTSNLLEMPSEMATQHVEQVMEESVSMIEVCEADQKESVETVINDSTEMAIKRQEEEAIVITENSGIPAEQEGLGGSKAPSIIPQSPEISVEDHKADLEEAKPDEPEVCTAARDARTEELAGKGPNETTMEPLTSTQRQLATPGNAGLAVSQNTGVITSVGNLESPSSLSLEFKLNIQFAQVKASTWPSAAPIERIEPVKQVDVSEAGVQAEESAESVRQRDEGKKQTELNEVAVQATSITEPEADSHLIQRAVIASQPVLQDVGIQAVETIEPLEQIRSTERAIAEVQTVEVCQPARQEKRAVLLRKPLLSEAKKGWAFKQSEDENDQDVWLDAEEDIYPQQDMQTSTEKVDERVKLQSESEEKDEAEPELEFEMACSLEAGDTESQRDALRKETSEIESEGEDFTVALEDLGTSVSVME